MILGLNTIPLFVILLSSPAIYGQTTDTKNVYRLKCFSSQHDCTIIKSNPTMNELEISNVNKEITFFLLIQM